MRAFLWSALLGVILWLRTFPYTATTPIRDPQQTHHVDRVIDGDTLLLRGGQRVRLLGVDTPELSREDRPAEPWSAEGFEFTRAFVAGGEITLGFDREPFDKYGRRLAYVYRQGRCLNEELIRAGFSRAETGFAYHESMKVRFRRAERAAHDAGRGLWREPSPAVVPESRPAGKI